jgi:hypothetical protein
MTAASPLRRKALAVIREGRLAVLNAWQDQPGADRRPVHVEAAVRSSRQGGPTYAVDLADDRWVCTCSQPQPCPHVAAVQLATGHGNPA